MFLYLAKQAFGNKLRWFDFWYRHISPCSPVRPSETSYVGSTLAIGIFLYLYNQAFGNKLRWFDSCYRYISVFSQSGLRKQTTLVRLLLSAYFCIYTIRPSETNYVGSTLAIVIFLYLANRAFGNKLRWFESCYWHISVFSQSGLRKQTTLVRLLLLAYFCI
jgi:hypothetical protein